MPEFIYILLIFAVAALVQGSIGFGFGLIALPLLSYWLNVREASQTIALSGFLLNLFLFLRLREHFDWKAIRFVFFLVLLTTPIGYGLLERLNERTLHLALGILLIVASLQRLFGFKLKWDGSRLFKLFCGVLGGILTGAFGTGGPPLLVYLSTLSMNHRQFVCAVQFLLGVGNLIRLSFIFAEVHCLRTACLIPYAGVWRW